MSLRFLIELTGGCDVINQGPEDLENGRMGRVISVGVRHMKSFFLITQYRDQCVVGIL